MKDIKGIGEISSSQICVIGSILEYLSLTQKQNIPHLPILELSIFIAI